MDPSAAWSFAILDLPWRPPNPRTYQAAGRSQGRPQNTQLGRFTCWFSQWVAPGRYGTMPYMSPEMAASAGHSFSAPAEFLSSWDLTPSQQVRIFGPLVLRAFAFILADQYTFLNWPVWRFTIYILIGGFKHFLLSVIFGMKIWLLYYFWNGLRPPV